MPRAIAAILEAAIITAITVGLIIITTAAAAAAAVTIIEDINIVATAGDLWGEIIRGAFIREAIDGKVIIIASLLEVVIG